MSSSNKTVFQQDYNRHIQHLNLQGFQPKTIEAYARGVRRIGAFFEYAIHDLSNQQMTDYFSQLLTTHSWSAVQLDLYGLKFFYTHVLGKTWQHEKLIKPPRAKRIPDIVSVEEANRLFAATEHVSYRVFYFTLYSMGLRLGEGLALEVGDVDAIRRRVHIRDAKGNKDRFVPLPDSTLRLLRRFWALHRNPLLLFPNRKGGLAASGQATIPMNRGGVQMAMKKVIAECGIKKRLPRTVCDTAMQPT